MPIDIVLDAMGSDKAPDPEIRGAILACRTLDVRVHLVGPEDLLRPKLREALKALNRGEKLPIFIVQASEWISMEDKAAQAVRSKRDSSMRVGLKMVREGRAGGFITAGNTGAAMATAKMVLGSLAGVDRPALASMLPTTPGTPCVLLDVGANVDWPYLFQERAAHRESAGGVAVDWRGRLEGQLADARHAAAAQGAAVELYGQRGRARSLQRASGRCGV
jgi:glycerol-3-phosphate acyltransferase PlsX